MDSEYVRAEKHCFSLFGFITLKFERNWHGTRKAIGASAMMTTFRFPDE